MGQVKGIKQKRKGSRIFDICFFVVSSCCGRILISGGGTGCWALPLANFEIFLISRGFLRSDCSSRSETREATHAQIVSY